KLIFEWTSSMSKVSRNDGEKCAPWLKILNCSRLSGASPSQVHKGLLSDQPHPVGGGHAFSPLFFAAALIVRVSGAAGLVRFLRVAGAVRPRAKTSQALQSHLVTVVAVQQAAFHARD